MWSYWTGGTERFAELFFPVVCRMGCCSEEDDAAVAPSLLPVIGPNHHLRLGITFKAMIEFMKRIKWDPNDGPGSNYVRNEEKLGWVTHRVGKYDPNISPMSGKKHNLTGFDFQEAIRTWLRKRGCAHMSVLEVLRKESNPGVGSATAFYSHALMPSFLGWNGTMARIAQACQTYQEELPEQSTFFFIDIFSLRQCELEKNWDVPMTISCIQACHCLIAEVDQDLHALKRSFVLFEMHCALKCRMPVLINTFLLQEEMNTMLHDSPLDWMASKAADRDVLEDMRTEVKKVPGGVKVMERSITGALRKGGRDDYVHSVAGVSGVVRRPKGKKYRAQDTIEREENMGKAFGGAKRYAW